MPKDLTAHSSFECTINRGDILLKKGLFKQNLINSSLEGITLKKFAKHLGVVFDELTDINYLDRQNSTIKKTALQLFDYIYEGFEWLSDSSKGKFGYELALDNYLNDQVKNFLGILKSVEYLFEYKFFNYLGDFDGYAQQTIDYFLNTTIYNVTFKSNLEFLHDNVFNLQDPKNASIFHLYLKELEHNVNVGKGCGSGPISGKIFNLYKKTLIGIIKGYTLLILGHAFARLKLDGDELKNREHKYLKQYQELIDNVSMSALQILSILEFEHQLFVNCDPNWKEGKNYIRVKNYVSNTLRNFESNDEEFELNDGNSQEFECNRYSVHSNFDGLTVYTMKCPDVFNTNSRLYKDCLNFPENKEILGTNYSSWPSKCFYLYNVPSLSSSCFCDKQSDPKLSIRKLSLRPLCTNTIKNEVITGIRFALKDNVIRIEIQKSQIKNGTIDSKTKEWKSADDYPLKEIPDIVTLDYNIKSFNLDDIQLQIGDLLTGVKFQLLKDNHISLAVRGTAMYNSYSQEPSNNHHWYYPKTLYDEERENIPLEDFHNSAELSWQNEELSQSGRNYVDLTVGIHSHKFKNIPVLPFFDSQNLISDMPLGGLGLYYKGYPSFGGFLAFKLADSQFNFNMIKCTINRGDTLLKEGLFKQNLINSSSEGITLKKVAKHLEVVFDELTDIHYLDRQNSTIKKTALQLFDYIYEGFELLSDSSKEKFGYEIEVALDNYLNDQVFNTNSRLYKDCLYFPENKEILGTNHSSWPSKCLYLDDVFPPTSCCFCDKQSDPKLKCTINRGETLLKEGLFKQNLINSSLEGITLKKFAKHLEVVFDELIDINYLDRQNSTIKKTALQLFDYIYEGFELLSNSSKGKFGYEVEVALDNYLNDKVKKFLGILKSVENLFEYKFFNYLGDFDGYTQKTIDYFLNTTIYNVTFKSNLEFLYDNVFNLQDPKNASIFHLYLKELEHNVNVGKGCGSGPISRKVFNLYKKTLIGSIKGYTMLILGYSFARLKLDGGELKNLQYEYSKRYSKIIDSVSMSALQILNFLEFEHQLFVNCDPKWKEGKNYIRVKNYVSNTLSTFERNTEGFKLNNGNSQEIECKHHLVHSNFDGLTVYSMRCPDVFSTNPRLYIDCLYFPENKEILGTNHSSWPSKCLYLDDVPSLSSSCFCDKQSDPKLSIRKLSLRPLCTNTIKNEVITGIRFAVKDNVIGIEIQKSQIKNGVIDSKTKEWKSADDYPLTEIPDIVTLDYNTKSFNLDDIQLQIGDHLTCVKLQLLKGNHISLAARGTAMNNSYSQELSNNHHWYYPKTLYDGKRENIPLEDFHNSAELSWQNKNLSRSGRNYVDLTVGIHSHKFTNIPILPFFDSQDLTSDVPLGGLGLYYKGYPSFGGFLAFKLADSPFNFNISDYEL
ncbi:hypothetical protein KQX54_019877 [Cotesia glomerata]|uniref:Uncharacterized protein n=1 Tax=Cotesia glomerata TaxID=32391 RepID=A0AAV7IDR9_COTGL|nr:hypothetical protein KQX54_019877 [Cotesia glomerata]